VPSIFSELGARVLGVAVDLGFALVRLESGLHLDAKIEGGGRLREREGALLGQDRLVLGRGALPVDRGDEAGVRRLDRGDDLVAAGHVPAVEVPAAHVDLREPQHDAAVVGEVEARALGEAQGAARVEDVEVGFVVIQALGRGADVMGHHEAGDDLAFLGDVDGLVRGHLDVGGEGRDEGEQGEEGGAHGVSKADGRLFTAKTFPPRPHMFHIRATP
jgi:hypothetical protein